MSVDIPDMANREDVPGIRQVSSLGNVPKIINRKPILAAKKALKPPYRDIYPYYKRIIAITLVFFAVFAFELWSIHRYSMLNKQLYDISLSLKNRAVILQKKLRNADILKNKLNAQRRRITDAYIRLSSKEDVLRSKIDDYMRISSAKTHKLNALAGNLRISRARVYSLRAQNEVLFGEIKKKGEYIRQLTSKVINAIGEQELLINKNLKLIGENEKIKKELLMLKKEKG